MNYLDMIEDYINLEKQTLDKIDRDSINDALNLLNEVRLKGAKVYIFGNGGSSSTASHMFNDFNICISNYIDQKFQFVCLNDNISSVMTIANDIGFEDVFKFQLERVVKPEDVIIAISGSGNSKNVIKAVEYAKTVGCKIIGFTGFDGGKLKDLSDISLHAPINSIQIAEDMHMIFNHLMISAFYKTLCGINHLKG